jgi:hypothetical protein
MTSDRGSQHQVDRDTLPVTREKIARLIIADPSGLRRVGAAYTMVRAQPSIRHRRLAHDSICGSPAGAPDATRVDGGVGSNDLRIAALAFLLVALLTGLAGNVLLLLAGLRLAALLLLPRRLLTAALLLAGLLVGSLRRLRSLVRIIHLSTSFG